MAVDPHRLAVPCKEHGLIGPRRKCANNASPGKAEGWYNSVRTLGVGMVDNARLRKFVPASHLAHAHVHGLEDNKPIGNDPAGKSRVDPGSYPDKVDDNRALCCPGGMRYAPARHLFLQPVPAGGGQLTQRRKRKQQSRSGSHLFQAHIVTFEGPS